MVPFLAPRSFPKNHVPITSTTFPAPHPLPILVTMFLSPAPRSFPRTTFPSLAPRSRPQHPVPVPVPGLPFRPQTRLLLPALLQPGRLITPGCWSGFPRAEGRDNSGNCLITARVMVMFFPSLIGGAEARGCERGEQRMPPSRPGKGQRGCCSPAGSRLRVHGCSQRAPELAALAARGWGRSPTATRCRRSRAGGGFL